MSNKNLFQSVTLAPRDPILGLNEAFAAETRPNKVNLGVGVYFDADGKIPLLQAVKIAEEQRVKLALPRGYLPIDGLKKYNEGVQNLLFAHGENAELLTQNRVVTVQSLGGTGALKLGADFIKRNVAPNATVYISDPTWVNHKNIFADAGFAVKTYAYYDAETRGVNFAALQRDIQKMQPNDIILLHACCHNPTGADLTAEQWQQIVNLCKERQIIPFLDMAYQGFADGIAEDALALNLFAKAGLSFFISSSFSKNFSMYGERVGALSVVTQSKDESERVLSQLKVVVRTNYSNPPTHGAALIAEILHSSELRKIWEDELAQMRDRIRKMRRNLMVSIDATNCQQDFDFITVQRGMFSYTGLSAEQVERLKKEFAIYAVSSGRICMAALNTKNVGYVAESIAAVL